MVLRDVTDIKMLFRVFTTYTKELPKLGLSSLWAP